MLVDSHCHLNLLKLDHHTDQLNTVIEQARKYDIRAILCVGIDLESSQKAIEIAENFDGVWASVGLHPSSHVESEPKEEDFIALATHPKVVAIGETGLDYYYSKENLENMRARFRRQIRVANKLNKPIIVHTRHAPDDTITIMQEEQANRACGVMHCFTESYAMAEQAMALGFYISFSGIVTFKKATEVCEVAEKIPLEKLLIETDSPYLAPVPHRGRPNLPENLRFVAARIAELKQLDLEVVIEQTTNNFFNLFHGATRP